MKAESNNRWRNCGETVYSWWECQMMQPPQQTVGRITPWFSCFPWGCHRATWLLTFTAASFVIAHVKQPECPSTGEYIRELDSYSASKRREEYTTTREHLEHLVPVTQRQRSVPSTCKQSQTMNVRGTGNGGRQGTGAGKTGRHCVMSTVSSLR